METTTARNLASTEPFNLLISERYSGDEFKNIDRIQEVWRRSLQIAFPQERNVYDLILCCREAVLNALVHGCDKSPDKICALQVFYNKQKELVRVKVDDPGLGHRFDLEDRLRRLDTLDGRHLGLAMISNFTHSFSIENDGSTLSFDFEIHSKQR